MTVRASKFKTSGLWSGIIRWFDSYAAVDNTYTEKKQIDWIRTLPFILMHLSCFAVIWIGWSPAAVAVAVFLYAIRMFAITGFYHRYFSHRAFKTSRLMQFFFAALAASAVQRGPLWWASHHRHHHACADQGNDPHSPDQHGFLWSHMAWFLSRDNFSPRHERIKDFSRYPEMRLLDRFDMLMPVVLAVLLYALGEWMALYYPDLGTNGLQMLLWGFVISTLVLYHVTFTINSLAHTYGSRRYSTKDNSRNNLLLALLTFGEGWHNNHHYYPGSARQGFFWWEIDITYYVLLVMEKLGLIYDLRAVPDRVIQLGERQ